LYKFLNPQHSAYVKNNAVKIYVLFLDTAHHYETYNTKMNKKYHNSTNDTEEMQCHFELSINGKLL